MIGKPFCKGSLAPVTVEHEYTGATVSLGRFTVAYGFRGASMADKIGVITCEGRDVILNKPTASARRVRKIRAAIMASAFRALTGARHRCADPFCHVTGVERRDGRKPRR